ncbi:hypothetical protein AB1E84_004230 [Yersinia enterocolitica]|nr:hypothetical protein [Yersinia enterocolitica]HEI6739927.1 hypothetical protein [Yersinia enterocolitica]HEI6830877.1 hypothetical protein [Yersinia enterocolitica]
MSGYQIILKARVNTAELVMRTIATITMEGNGGDSFDAQFFSEYPGKVLRRNMG